MAVNTGAQQRKGCLGGCLALLFGVAVLVFVSRSATSHEQVANAPVAATAIVVATPSLSCEDAPSALITAISTGLKGGTHLISLQAVQSPEHSMAWYVSGYLNGPGLPAQSAIATWATNRLDGSGAVYAVGGYATQFSDWADGGRTAAAFSRSDAAAQRSISCVQGK